MNAAMVPGVAPREADDHGQHGAAVAGALHFLFRNALLHASNNAASIQAASGVATAVNLAMLEVGGVLLQAADDFLFLNGVRVRPTRASNAGVHGLMRIFAENAIGGLHVLRPIEARDALELTETVRFLRSTHSDEDASLADALRHIDSPFEVVAAATLTSRDSAVVRHAGPRRGVREAYHLALEVTHALAHPTATTARPDFHPAKRVVQRLVDCLFEAEFPLLGMTALDASDQHDLYHSVNVCIYALAMGKRIGLARNDLRDLGVAALFHDLGRVHVHTELADASGAPDDATRAALERHPLEGVKEILRLYGVGPLALRCMIGAFEHNLRFDGDPGPLPLLAASYRPHVAGRILAIADYFESLTARGAAGGPALRRDQALALLLQESGRRFDPVLVRAFAGVLGVYPVGSLVRLRSGRCAIVVRSATDAHDGLRPIVRIVEESGGRPPEEAAASAGRDVDLARRTPSGFFEDEIVEVLRADDMQLDLTPYVG